MYEPPYIADKNGHKPPDHEAQLKKLISSGHRGDAVMYFMRKMVGVPTIFTVMMRLMFPIWSKLKDAAHTLPYDAAVMGDFSLPADRVAAVTVPTIAIGGEKSDVRLCHAVEAVADTLPGAELRTLKGQTHNVAAAALAPVLVEFFAA